MKHPKMSEELRGLLPTNRARMRRKKRPLGLALEVSTRRGAEYLTQEDLAAKAGVSLNAVRKIEQGDVHFNFVTLLKVLNALKAELITVTKSDQGEL
jgi:predicted transcriptional regulator